MTVRNLYSDSSERIYIEYNSNGTVELVKAYHPLGINYGNRVETHVIVYDDAVEVRTVRYNWDGTGVDIVAEVYDEELAKNLKDVLNSIQTVGDIYKLDDVIDLIEKKIEGKNKEIEKKVEELIDEVAQSLKIDKSKLGDINELKEEVMEMLNEIVSDTV